MFRFIYSCIIFTTLKNFNPKATVFQGDCYLECVTLWFPWWRVIACHVTHRSNNRAEWMMICFYVIFPFLFKILTNVLDMAWNVWYSDCRIYASGSVLLFKHLNNDRVSWAVCAMGAAILVCAADAVQRIGSVGFTTREFIHFSRYT